MIDLAILKSLCAFLGISPRSADLVVEQGVAPPSLPVSARASEHSKFARGCDMPAIVLVNASSVVRAHRLKCLRVILL
jgi:hypothetical protein